VCHDLYSDSLARGVTQVLDFFSSVLFGLTAAEEVPALRASNLQALISEEWVAALLQPRLAPDPTAEAIAQKHLNSVTAAGDMPVTSQGIWIQSDRQIFAVHEGETPLSAASLTKVATTLAALGTWAPDHQFVTRVSVTGTVQDGVLEGDLVVQGGGDPLFVWEEAIALGNALEAAGITQVNGDLIVSSDFVMNFETDPEKSAGLLRRGIHADLWNREAAIQFATLPQDTPRPRVQVNGELQVLPLSELDQLSAQPLILHASLPMVDLLKAMNTYSNNVMAEMIANQIGGAAIVSRKATEMAGIPQSEVQLINGSGLGEENRLSPRAVAAMLVAIQNQGKQEGYNVADLFPVLGQDTGTLVGRDIPAGSAVKTGTLDRVSSLAGVIPTRDRGLIWFTLINVGSADLGTLHDYQDVLLQELTQAWGEPVPLPLELTPHSRPVISQLGSPERNQVL
jgi:D-alanyl-D-alanine carboxypeptidase/D-alanyl-D-alanine-endopeptidase (penicillin-binding protein 4)